MVALEEDVFSFSAAQFVHQVQNVARTWAAVDIISDEYHGIALHGRNRSHHRGQFIDASMNIADGE